jgi:hypothetical protein
MDQAWFEMREIRRKHLDGAVWIPLRVSETTESGAPGHLGYRMEFLGLTSVAIPVAQREKAQRLEWSAIGLRNSHGGYVVNGEYVPADVFKDGELNGVYLVLEQDGNREESREWHLHQDLVITLRLKREGDTWIAINEGYIDVARLRRQNGKPSVLEIRAEHLKDYLCARGMGLFVSSYRDREEVVQDASHIRWAEDPQRDESGGDRWEGRKTEIHEGGMPFGATFAVVHGGRTDVSGEDIPAISPTDESLTATTWHGKYEERSLCASRANCGAKSGWVQQQKARASVVTNSRRRFRF